ncbi:MAG TPA: hypothetical protein VKR21_02925 [Solirubrobacteraceae bacterium]|nr:hypothetical protein [Solirubrobacteraceae bacterium]
MASGSATGTVTAVSGSSFTIQTTGPRVGVVNALTQTATSVTQRDYPYVYGGGHAEAGIASTGVRAHGSRRHPVGFDCSGSVAAVLAGAGLWPAGTGVPNDAGVIASLRARHLIAAGVGRGPVEVTLYDHANVHIFMNIDGRFFGTSDGGGGGNPNGGAGWLDDGAPDASRHAYRAYHFLPAVVRSSTTAGHIIGFELTDLLGTTAFQVGDVIQVGYQEDPSGALLATSVAYPGSAVMSGTVSAIAPDGSSFTVQTPAGASLTFAVTNPQLLQGVTVGDTTEVTYTSNASVQTARVVTVTATGSVAATGGPDTAS